MQWINNILFIGIFINNVADCKSRSRRKVREYSAKIMNRPKEIPTTKCGENIHLTCVAEGEPVPDIEWWFQGEAPDQGQNEIIRNLAREGRIRIKTEELYVIRSTLIIRDVEELDEGIYQCRASNSRARRNKNINLYQHWKVEEVPLHKVMCKDDSMTRTEIFPASKYNQSVFEEAVERAVTSFTETTSSETFTSNSQPSGSDSTTSSQDVDEKRLDIESATTPFTTSSTTNDVTTHSSTTRVVTTTRVSKVKDMNAEKKVHEDNSDDGPIPLTESSKYSSSEQKTLRQGGDGGGCRNSGRSMSHRGPTMSLLYVLTTVILTSRWS